MVAGHRRLRRGREGETQECDGVKRKFNPKPFHVFLLFVFDSVACWRFVSKPGSILCVFGHLVVLGGHLARGLRGVLERLGDGVAMPGRSSPVSGARVLPSQGNSAGSFINVRELTVAPGL